MFCTVSDQPDALTRDHVLTDLQKCSDEHEPHARALVLSVRNYWLGCNFPEGDSDQAASE